MIGMFLLSNYLETALGTLYPGFLVRRRSELHTDRQQTASFGSELKLAVPVIYLSHKHSEKRLLCQLQKR